MYLLVRYRTVTAGIGMLKRGMINMVRIKNKEFSLSSATLPDFPDASEPMTNIFKFKDGPIIVAVE